MLQCIKCRVNKALLLLFNTENANLVYQDFEIIQHFLELKRKPAVFFH